MNQNNFNPVINNENTAVPAPELNQPGQEAVSEVLIQATPENTIQVGGPVPDPINDDQSNMSGVIIDNTNIIEEPTSEIIKNEVKEETSSHVDKDDREYIVKVKEVMKKDANLPYNEEEDAEALNKSYLKSRFGVDVNIDEEN